MNTTKCECGGDSLVYDSRERSNGTYRRRRECTECGKRWSTTEIISTHDESLMTEEDFRESLLSLIKTGTDNFLPDAAIYGALSVALFKVQRSMDADELDGRCRKCGGNMIHGKAIQQTLTGTPDFPGDDHAVTLSPGGSGKLINCLKCEKCGWSVTG